MTRVAYSVSPKISTSQSDEPKQKVVHGRFSIVVTGQGDCERELVKKKKNQPDVFIQNMLSDKMILEKNKSRY